MQGIIASVGNRGINRKNDVRVVQQLLNQHQIPWHPMQLISDGVAGPKTTRQIVGFQKYILKMIRPDGRVDPNGRMIRALNKCIDSKEVACSSTKQIDWSFIETLEGRKQTKAYVPTPKESESGATIASGFDLGARNKKDLLNLGLPTKLIKKFEPYLGKKKGEAKSFLDKNQLSITAAEAELIDKAVRKSMIEKLKKSYNNAPNNKNGIDFSSLPSKIQTVITSVAFQYGTNLNLRTPVFWKAVTAQDWNKTSSVLRNFGDNYCTRRNKEADLLEALIK